MNYIRALNIYHKTQRYVTSPSEFWNVFCNSLIWCCYIHVLEKTVPENDLILSSSRTSLSNPKAYIGNNNSCWLHMLLKMRLPVKYIDVKYSDAWNVYQPPCFVDMCSCICFVTRLYNLLCSRRNLWLSLLWCFF